MNTVFKLMFLKIMFLFVSANFKALAKEDIVADLSKNKVEISTTFSGAEILLFGAYEGKKNDELKELIDLLNDNLSKIVFHGKRADSIVKGMLLHSRGKSGEKTLTNLNELLDEYLNLSYHGMRAKDGSFNIELLTDFNNSIPQILMVQQDMSRVFVNLFNNAFQATLKKSSIIDSQYKPYIKVKSDFINSMAIVTIEDNGIGIPSSISNNIFNPKGN